MHIGFCPYRPSDITLDLLVFIVDSSPGESHSADPRTVGEKTTNLIFRNLNKVDL